MREPHATICLLSALELHALTTEVPHAVWVMIGRHARMPKLSYPKLELVRASGSAFTHGIEPRHIDGVEVPVTCAAKTVADCFDASTLEVGPIREEQDYGGVRLVLNA